MWKFTEHKCSSQRQEIEVKKLVKEMAKYSYATHPEQFKAHFDLKLSCIKRHNKFSAENLYEVTPRNEKSLEVWKLTASGDFKYKMFTLDYLGQ